MSSDKFKIGERTLKSTKNLQVSSSSVNLNQIKSRKATKANSGQTPNKNLQINIARQGTSGPETIQSKVSSTQSASRNLLKGQINFVNTASSKKDKPNVVIDQINYPQAFDSKKRKEHPSFFEVSNKPSHDESSFVNYANYINKAPLPKHHQQQVSQLSLRQ